MRLIKKFDSKNYLENKKRFKRDSVRGIIFYNHMLVMVRSTKYGDYKFPGGGIEKNESHTEALTRETKEETGLQIIPSTIKEYGETIILRKGFYDDEIFEQVSYYYTCEIESSHALETNRDDYEIEYGYELVYVSIEEAISGNEGLLNRQEVPWVERELFVLNELLKSPEYRGL